jgi:tetratricopeptide (TPR) repeat protein
LYCRLRDRTAARSPPPLFVCDNPQMTSTLRSIASALAFVLLGIGGLHAQARVPHDDVLKQAQQQLREGHLDEALALTRKAADEAPTSLQANTQAGVILDLQGRYTEARTYFEKAMSAASSPDEKSRALRNMAMSFGFERDCDGALKYQQQAYDLRLAGKDFSGAAEVANEVARVCLESNGIEQAGAWYRRGYDTALKSPDLSPAQKDLWEFRWEHAQARLAARRGQQAEARRHMAAAKAVLDTGTNPEQAPFFPYLAGYVDFHSGDYKAALAELQKGNQNDPFILALIAQSHEKLGDQAQAKEIYRRILTFTSHNPTNAYARPLAAEKVRRESGSGR